MNTTREQSAAATRCRRFGSGVAALVVAALTTLLVQGCAQEQLSAEPRAFPSPDEAVRALTVALRADDMDQLRAIVGSDGEPIISSGDPVADRQRRQKFLTLYDEKHSVVEEKKDAATLVIGRNEWPFPVPLARHADGWVFDSRAGLEEILNRRIGENELSAIEVCRAIGDAQREYALKDPDGNGVSDYAQQLASDPGRRNGLYWPAAPGEEPSPLGELIATATAEGYTRKQNGPTPYHGYCYRVLREQGPDAPNGALDYVVNGKMTLGFAVVAYPADYGSSGVMTFLMGPDGTVHEKDLGEKTAEAAGAMKAFNPGAGWAKVR